MPSPDPIHSPSLCQGHYHCCHHLSSLQSTSPRQKTSNPIFLILVKFYYYSWIFHVKNFFAKARAPPPLHALYRTGSNIALHGRPRPGRNDPLRTGSEKRPEYGPCTESEIDESSDDGSFRMMMTMTMTMIMMLHLANSPFTMISLQGPMTATTTTN